MVCVKQAMQEVECQLNTAQAHSHFIYQCRKSDLLPINKLGIPVLIDLINTYLS